MRVMYSVDRVHVDRWLRQQTLDHRFVAVEARDHERCLALLLHTTIKH